MASAPNDGESPESFLARRDIAAKIAEWSTPRASESENRQTRLTPSQASGEHGRNLAADVNASWATPRAEGFDAGAHPSGADSLHAQQQAAAAERFLETPSAALGGASISRAVPTPGMAARVPVNGGGNLLETVAAEMWPTPMGRDGKDTGDMSRVNAREGRPPDTVARVVQATDPKDIAPLNPQFVEILMGFPVDFTVVPDYVAPKPAKKAKS
jgi:hypothetical protein